MTARKTTAKANDKDNTTPIETTILMFGSEKGGLGKTTVALVAAEQMTAANHPFFLVDADASTPNVGLTYRKEIYEQFRHQGVKDADLLPSIYNLNKAGDRAATSILEEQITFTGDNNDFFLADRIFDIAKTQDVAIVLPSQVASYVNRWLRQNDVVGLLADPDNTIKFVYYFITNGTSESLDLFEESVEAFGGKIPHVLVKNLGAPTNIRWNRFDEDGRVQALLDKYGFQSIFFPEILIAPEDKEKILSEYIQFGEAIASDWIPFSTKRRLTKCLKDATQALGSTGYIPYHPSYIPEEVIAEAVTTTASFTTDAHAAVTDPTIELDAITS
jgi:CobQ/CobB/MinD/ParA nucleotide binding domain